MRHGDYEDGGVFLLGLVEGDVLGAQDCPEFLPLADTAFGFEDVEVALPHYALCVVGDVEAGYLARVPGCFGAGGGVE